MVENIEKLVYQSLIYGYPIIDMYRILHNFALDPKSPEFKAPLNSFGHSHAVADPKDTSIVAMNVDTPYSYAWLDLRAEPLVVHFPKFGEDRYVSAELFDLYTNIVGYVSPRTNGYSGGDFLIYGPTWGDTIPQGLNGAFQCTTDLMLILMRTQLFGDADMPNVISIQNQCSITPLSKSKYNVSYKPKLVQPLQPIQPVDVRKPLGTSFFTVLKWMQNYMPPLAEDTTFRAQLSASGWLQPEQLDTKQKNIITKYLNAGMQQIYAKAKTIKSSAELFGSRDFYGGNYLVRATAAFLGILGNSADEYLGVGYQADQKGDAFNGSKQYTITFASGSLPPVDAFWSITIYNDKKLLHENTINRYVINTPLLPAMHKNADAGFTIYIQNTQPAGIEKTNWLPCPAGDFGITFRTYLPQAPIRNGKWQAPPVVPNESN